MILCRIKSYNAIRSMCLHFNNSSRMTRSPLYLFTLSPSSSFPLSSSLLFSLPLDAHSSFKQSLHFYSVLFCSVLFYSRLIFLFSCTSLTPSSPLSSPLSSFSFSLPFSFFSNSSHLQDIQWPLAQHQYFTTILRAISILRNRGRRGSGQIAS